MRRSLQILLIGVLVGLVPGHQATAGRLVPLDIAGAISACPICSSYFAWIAAGGKDAETGAPAATPSALPSGMVCTGGSTTEAAKGPVYPLIGPYCESSRLGKASQKENQKVASAYTAAGGACMALGAACIALMVAMLGFGGVMTPAFTYVCAGGGATATAVDQISFSKITAEGKEAMQSMSGNGTGVNTTTAVSAAGTGGVATAATFFDVACFGPFILGAQYLAIAQVRQQNGQKQAKSGQENCQKVQQLLDNNKSIRVAPLPTCSMRPVENYGSSNSVNRPDKAGVTGSATAVSQGCASPDAINAGGPVDENYFGDGVMQAAASGFGGEMIGKDPGKWGKAVDQLATGLKLNLPQIESKMTAGATSFSIASDVITSMNLPVGKTEKLVSVLNSLKKLDALAKSGKLFDPSVYNMGGPTAPKPAAGKASAVPSKRPRWIPRGRFGAKEEEGAAVSELEFGAHAKDGSSDLGSDIWHAEWKGSLFEIISTRTAASREAVDPGEWLVPANRSIAGLPPLPPGATDDPAIPRDKPYTIQELEQMNKKVENPLTPEHLKKDLPFVEPDQEVK